MIAFADAQQGKRRNANKIKGFGVRVNPATPQGFSASVHQELRGFCLAIANEAQDCPGPAGLPGAETDSGLLPKALKSHAKTQMTRLSAYLVRLFARDALAIFTVGLVLLYLIQCLRIFDVVSVNGQSLFTLLGQAALGMPALAIVFGYVCMGIGLARGLAALQSSQELHIIHSNRRVRALLTAIAVFAGVGTLIVLLLSNFVEPAANGRLNDWSASVAADIVGRTLTPHRFSEVVPNVVIVIGGRQGTGQISDFFADDRRDPDMRRSYIAKAAVVAEDHDGYVLELHDGSIQYLSSDNEFSQVSFHRYNITLSRLIEPLENRDRLAESNSFELLLGAVSSGIWSEDLASRLTGRLGDGLKVVAMCLFVAAMAVFPHARRKRFAVPLEIAVLVVAFIESAIGTYAPGPKLVVLVAGSLLVSLVSLLLLLYRLRVFAPRIRPGLAT